MARIRNGSHLGMNFAPGSVRSLISTCLHALPSIASPGLRLGAPDICTETHPLEPLEYEKASSLWLNLLTSIAHPLRISYLYLVTVARRRPALRRT